MKQPPEDATLILICAGEGEVGSVFVAPTVEGLMDNLCTGGFLYHAVGDIADMIYAHDDWDYGRHELQRFPEVALIVARPEGGPHPILW